jgi:hypothetical protein
MSRASAERIVQATLPALSAARRSRGTFAAAAIFFLLAISSHADDWRKTLTAPTPGAFPALRPLRAKYRFGWSSFDAAEAGFEITRNGDNLLKLEVAVRSKGVVRKLWKMDGTHVAVCHAATLRPVSMMQVETYKKETLTTKLDFSEKGVARLREAKPADKNPPKTKRFEFAGLFDLFTAMLFVRSQPLQTGDVLRLVVYPATDPYLAEVEVRGREQIEVADEKRDAIALGIKLRRITKKLEIAPHAKFKRATAWIGADRDRLLLKIEAEVFVGSVRTELEEVKFGGGQ